jgi:hypothetical protein
MATSSMESKSFFTSLFDFGFTSFITLRFMKWIYAILVVLILLVGFIFFLRGLTIGDANAILVAIVIVPIVTLVYLVMARVWMEMIVLFFRIGENTSRMTTLLNSMSSHGGPGGPHDPGPPSQGWGGPPGPQHPPQGPHGPGTP